jgi:predicted outer membrane lipoprotein
MEKIYEEKTLKAKNGMPFLFLWILLYLLALAMTIVGGMWLEEGGSRFAILSL